MNELIVNADGNKRTHCALGWTNSSGVGIDTQNFFVAFFGELENE